tara:strand:- start:2454 stop:4943 length:2490 start_codon:yes stop_codon:yes gene_type:complete
MAIERGLGAGGIPDEVPLNEGLLQNIIELPQQPSVTEFTDGSAIVGEFQDEQPPAMTVPFDGNLADVIDEAELNRISSDLVGSIEDDLSSREDWEDTYKTGLEFLGMKTEERTEPFEGSSGVIHPLLAESVTQFQAQAYRELLPATGPVRTQVVGAQNEMLVKQAERVKDYMNYMITYEMEEYDPELDQMLFYLPVTGSTFKKVYFDPLKGRAVSKFLHAEDIIVPYGATDLLSSPRITHRLTMDSNEIKKLQLNGFYRDVEIPESQYGGEYGGSQIEESIDDVQGVHPSGPSEDITLYEVHASLDIEGFEDMGPDGMPSGLKLPYIITIIESSGEVLSVRRNYVEVDPMKRAKQYFVHYKFLPGLGFYGLGLTHMIGGLAQASTSILRQLIDAGTLSNLPAGFKSRGARIRDEDSPLQPGEFRDIDVVGGTLQGSLMPLPFKEPSGTLYNLMGTLVDAGRRFASMADMKIGEMSGETPVGTTMAIMERGTKVMSAIHKRMHYSQKVEFKLLSNIFAETVQAYPYAADMQMGPEIFAQDFDARVDVLPVSDPNIFSMSQRIALAQTELQLVQSNPQIHGGPQGLYQAYRKMYEALGVNNIDAILPPPPQPMPMNPAKENQNALMGAPLQAFPDQDHESHIETHMAVMSTPAMELNPQSIVALQGHIQEHIGLLAEGQAQQEIMSQIPPEQMQMMQQQAQMMPPQQGPQGPMPPDPMMQFKPQIDARAAEIIAEMTEQLAQAVAPPPQSDPLVDIRNQELQLKAADLQRKQEEFDSKQDLNREKERNDVLIAQQRIDAQEKAIDERARVAEERIKTQRDIAAINSIDKRR